MSLLKLCMCGFICYNEKNFVSFDEIPRKYRGNPLTNKLGDFFVKRRKVIYIYNQYRALTEYEKERIF